MMHIIKCTIGKAIHYLWMAYGYRNIPPYPTDLKSKMYITGGNSIIQLYKLKKKRGHTMNNLIINQIDVEKIKPYDNNAKMHDQSQIDAVAKSIEQFGFVQPIVIDKSFNIVIGHCRYLASKNLGLTEVPCVIVEELSEEQVSALRLADNKLNESEWDTELLKLCLEDIATIDMSDFGFDAVFDDEDIEPIDDENIATNSNDGHKMTIDKTKIILDDDEYNNLISLYNQYTEKNGVSFGFVRSLLND